jgi:hypothetical protein
MILFGGAIDGGALGDTWELTFAGTPLWNELSPDGTLPGPRFYDTLVYDSLGDQMLVFGGTDSTAEADTWALHLAGPEWEKISAGGPPARWIHAAIFDPLRRRMIVFGGLSAYTSALNDTWDLSLDPQPVWRQTVPPISNPPSARHDYAAAYDPIRRRLVLFGGNTCAGACYEGDTWLLNLSGPPIWTKTDALGPAPRFGATMVYDSARDRMLLFGGGSATPCGEDQCLFNLNDTWALPLAGSLQWEPVSAGGQLPPERYYHSAIYDPVRDRMLIYGGDGYNLFADLWALTFAGTPTWHMLTAAGATPGQRYEHAALYDPLRDRMLLVGGVDFTKWYNDVWDLSLADPLSWTQLAPTGPAPAPRGRFALVYDSLADRLVLFGGVTNLVTYNDTWALPLGESLIWTGLPSSNTPPNPRGYLGGVYDTPGDRLVIFGGYTPSQNLGDLWGLEWSRVTSAPEPSPPPAGFRLSVPTIASLHAAFPVTITTAETGRCSFSLFDVRGRTVWTQDFSSLERGTVTIHLNFNSRVRPGVYILLARQAAAVASSKICLLPMRR